KDSETIGVGLREISQETLKLNNFSVQKDAALNVSDAVTSTGSPAVNLNLTDVSGITHADGDYDTFTLVGDDGNASKVFIKAVDSSANNPTTFFEVNVADADPATGVLTVQLTGSGAA